MFNDIREAHLCKTCVHEQEFPSMHIRLFWRNSENEKSHGMSACKTFDLAFIIINKSIVTDLKLTR